MSKIVYITNAIQIIVTNVTAYSNQNAKYIIFYEININIINYH